MANDSVAVTLCKGTKLLNTPVMSTNHLTTCYNVTGKGRKMYGVSKNFRLLESFYDYFDAAQFAANGEPPKEI